MLNKIKTALPILALVILSACTAGVDYPGLEYAPQMYHSVPYDALTQIKDKEAGTWISNREDELGEFYNSNPNNEYEQNMRVPVAGTVRRTANGMLPYRIVKDDIVTAAAMESPLNDSPENLVEGKRLYELYCDHCHGKTGAEAGLVGAVFAGVPSFKSVAQRDLSEGHIFHVITYGIRRMGAHGSQISPEKRWKIVKYVQQLQNQ
jgi:mono/diheme cytochrome c family protein